MKDIANNLNKYAFTSYTVGTRTEYVMVRAIKEAVEEADANKHLDIILRNVFTGTLEAKTILARRLYLDKIRPFWSKPFCLLIPISNPWDISIKPVEMVDFLPEGWNYDDPCVITRDDPDYIISKKDYIINLRTKEVIFLRSDADPVIQILSGGCPHVIGEALSIFSLFITKLDAFGCMTACRAPVPSGLAWFEKFGESCEESSTSSASSTSSTSFFSEESSSDDSELISLTAIPDSAYMYIPVDTSTFLVDELNIGAYMQHKLEDNNEPLQYDVNFNEARISYLDQIHNRFGYFRVEDDNSLAASRWCGRVKPTYKKQNCFIPTGYEIDPMKVYIIG